MSDSLANPTQSNAARAPRGVFVTIQPRIEADGSIVLSDRGWRYAARAAMPIFITLIALIFFIASPPTRFPHMDLYIAPVLVIMLVHALIEWRASDVVTLDALSGNIKWIARRGIYTCYYAEHQLKDVAVVSCRVQWDQGKSTRRDKWGQRVELGLADTSGVAIVAGRKAMLLKGSHDANEIHAYIDSLPEPLKRLERAEPWLIAIE
ncbi:MAG: hypothetical protein KF902_01035 [Phycisphaeraceae bacterium]|nr:hypothetical protein [Phycisphaeraceae bacterium]